MMIFVDGSFLDSSLCLYDASLNLLLHWVRTLQKSLKSLAIISAECETDEGVDGAT